MNIEERRELRAYERESLHNAAVRYGNALLVGEDAAELESVFWHTYDLLTGKRDDSEDRSFVIMGEWVEDCLYAKQELEGLIRYLWPLPYTEYYDIIQPMLVKVAALAKIGNTAAIAGLAG